MKKIKKLNESVKFRFPELSPELQIPLGGPEKIGGFLVWKTKKNVGQIRILMFFHMLRATRTN